MIVEWIKKPTKWHSLTIQQSCWTRTQNNSKSTSSSLCEIWKASPRTCMSFNSPRIGSPRPSTRSSSPRHPLTENEYSIPGQNTEHRTLVLWRRWLQALGLFYKKNISNNNTAYPICKINLSFISFLWVERWSGGADVESRNTHMHLLSAQLHNWFWSEPVLRGHGKPSRPAFPKSKAGLGPFKAGTVFNQSINQNK